jgi:hypothetical protein
MCMRDRIPKSIADRCEFETRDSITTVTKIRPAGACECGEFTESVRVVKIHWPVDPYPHTRHYCYSCKRTSKDGCVWYAVARDLNDQMRAERAQKNQEKIIKD